MELVVRAAVMFVVLFVLVRVTGKRELAEMSAFEMVLLIVLGDVVQQAITQEDSSITGAVLTAGTLVFLVVVTGTIAHRFPRFGAVVDGTPVVLIRDGRFVESALALERLSIGDLMVELRERGIADVGQVDLGILEPDGRFSFLVETGGGDRPDNHLL